VQSLVTAQYLSAAPSGNWHTYQDTAVVTNIEQLQCEALNAKVNVSGIPLCTDPAIAGQTVCCEQTAN
jgi:hypothetical protein